MILKKTQVIFLDGEYKGEYDWKGGIPLSVNELMTVQLKNPPRDLQYVLEKKTVDLIDQGENQLVQVVYRFREKK
jgi:hypothetical protein